jgi:hypothetical protein
MPCWRVTEEVAWIPAIRGLTLKEVNCLPGSFKNGTRDSLDKMDFKIPYLLRLEEDGHRHNRTKKSTPGTDF